VNPLKHGWLHDILGGMTFSNLVLGLVIGLPMMIAVGPISVLLFDQGLERGIRVAAPAAFGVAAADLTLATVAGVAGGSVTAALSPVTTWLTLGAVAVLAWLAFDLSRSALAELRAARASVPGTVAARDAGQLVSVGASAGVATSTPVITTPSSTPPTSTFGHLEGLRLSVAFYGLTLVNPLTLVLFGSVVIAGGAGVGTGGWVIGMALASLLAHGAFVVGGGMLSSALTPLAAARLRLGAAVFMAGLGVHFLLGA
jgi:threonine/homoserine/homoserine lactone efflux protein